MTQPVTPIPAFDGSTGITAVTSPTVLPKAPPPELSARFEQLMNQSGVNNDKPPSQTALGNTVQAMSDSQRLVDVDMRRAMEAIPYLDMQSMHQMNMSMIMRTGMAAAQLTVTTSVAQSGKNSLNTLMKNQ